MVELAETRAVVLGCFAEPRALDALEGAFRVAPDEAMLISAEGRDVVGTAIARISPHDDDALVLDMSDGWAIWTLRGDDVERAFSHLSAIEIPDTGYASGDVARVPARIVARQDRIHLIIPAMWRDYLGERIVHDCRGLGIREAPEPGAWEEQA